MRRALVAWLVSGLLALVPLSAMGQGQSARNPDISFITDFRMLTADATPDELEFRLEELEIGATGYLNPFARGDIFLGIHDGNLDIEEAYITFTALPGGWGVRGGKYRVPIGQFVPEHPHTFPWLEYPLYVQEFFTEEGYSDLGLNPSFLLGLGNLPITLTLDVLEGDFVAHDHGEGEGGGDPAAPGVLAVSQEEDPGGGEEPGKTLSDLAYNGRASAFFTLGRFTWFNIGGGVGTGIYDPDEALRTVWYEADFKYKWLPSRRKSFSLAGEFMRQARDVADSTGVKHTVEPYGFFAYGTYQFWRNWYLGGFVDYTQEALEPDHDQLGYGGYAGYSLYEETAILRLLVRRDEFTEAPDATSVILQILFGLGPHKPHRF